MGRQHETVWTLKWSTHSTYEPDEGPTILPRRVVREQLARGRRRDDAHACDGSEGERGCRGEDWGRHLGCVGHRSCFSLCVYRWSGQRASGRDGVCKCGVSDDDGENAVASLARSGTQRHHASLCRWQL